MREEPVIYINGRPYVVREADAPFTNLEYTGITRARVEDMEARLKQDVCQEVPKYNSQVLLAFEGDDFQIIEAWEPTTDFDVQTPLEVYQELRGRWRALVGSGVGGGGRRCCCLLRCGAAWLCTHEQKERSHTNTYTHT